MSELNDVLINHIANVHIIQFRLFILGNHWLSVISPFELHVDAFKDSPSSASQPPKCTDKLQNAVRKSNSVSSCGCSEITVLVFVCFVHYVGCCFFLDSLLAHGDVLL